MSLSVTGFTPFLIASTVCCPLWAINVAQAARYYRVYPADSKFLKWLVGVCIFLNTAQLAVLAYSVYFWLVTCRLPTNYLLLGTLDRSMAPSYLTYLLTTVVQAFYAMRVWFVSEKNKYIVTAIGTLSIMQLAGGFSLCTYMSIINSIVSVYSKFNHIAGGIELGSSMLCDIIISGSLVYFLRGRRLHGYRTTKNAVNTLILYSVNIGLLTNVVALTNLVTWLAAPESDFTWAVFHFALGKIYVSSMLVSLNARASIRQQMNPGDYVMPGVTTLDVDGVYPTCQVDIPLSNRTDSSGSSRPTQSDAF